MKKSLIALSFLLTLCACQKPSVEKVTVQDVALTPPPEANADIRIDEPVGNADDKIVDQAKFPPPIAAPDKEITKKIIKQGDISFETANIQNTRKAIYDQLNKLGGYISEEKESNDSETNQKSYTINARIPAKNFDVFLSGVSENAVKIDSKKISIRDVTTEYIDETTRLANKKKLEERYLELLKKGDKMADILQIEAKLNDIRTDIESTQGRLNYLTKQVEYSSLEINFYTKQAASDGNTFGYKLSHAVLSGWSSLVAFFFSVIAMWPFWLVLGILIDLTRRWFKKRLAKKKAV